MLEIKSGGISYRFGKITSFTDSFSKSVSTTPIVSLPTDCTFPLETSASLSYNVSFARVSPKDYDDDSEDSDRWCNATWVQRVSSLANRWQARVDGYDMVFEEYDDNGNLNPYVPSRRDRVFIKKLSFSQDAGYTDYLTGSMQLRVGSARTSSALPMPESGKFNIPKEYDIPWDSSYVILTSPNRYKSYLLQFGATSTGDKDYDESRSSVDCVNSYTVTGGPSTPFECMQLKVSRKKLTQLYPDLGKSADHTFETDILAGRSKVIFRGIGEGSMVVSNCKMSSDEYVITAYCAAEVYRGMILGSPMTENPKTAILNLLTRVQGALFNENQVIFHIQKEISNPIGFKSTTTYWQALQICAGHLNAKIFFANDKAYIIDYSIPYKQDASICTPNLYASIEIHPESITDPMYGRTVGQASYGNEGQDTIINTQSVKCSGSGEEIVETADDDPSIATYQMKEGATLDISNYVVLSSDLKVILPNLADHIVNYACEPQKSVSFSVKEQVFEGGKGMWVQTFPTCMCVRTISSSVDGITISNKTTSAGRDGERTQKLYLSQYHRQYPKMVTEYTFGVIANIDLQSTISKLQKG